MGPVSLSRVSSRHAPLPHVASSRPTLILYKFTQKREQGDLKKNPSYLLCTLVCDLSVDESHFQVILQCHNRRHMFSNICLIVFPAFIFFRELDVGAMREAAALLVGTHDFSSFTANSHETVFRNPVRKMDVVSIQPGVSFAHSYFHR